MPADGREPRATRRLSYRVADRLTEADVVARLRRALAGVDPTVAIPGLAAPRGPVVWEDAGDAVLVHLDSVQVRLVDRMLVATVDLEADQTGRGAVVVRLVFGARNDGAALIASTDEITHGHTALAGRWGAIVRDVVWAVLCGTADAHARERGLAPRAIRIAARQMTFATTPDIPLPDRLGTPLPPRGTGRPPRPEPPPRVDPQPAPPVAPPRPRPAPPTPRRPTPPTPGRPR